VASRPRATVIAPNHRREIANDHHKVIAALAASDYETTLWSVVAINPLRPGAR
jgi:hypothetical protein